VALSQDGNSAEDIGLYFLHWLTDLAGAEATPLAGAEKLTLKFPQHVLFSFLHSVPFVSQLVGMSETELVEEYLVERWRQLCPQSQVPVSKDAVARMRLMIMAQKSGEKVMAAFDQLPGTARDRLAEELSRTGCAGQGYSTFTAEGGPAFLLYYGPALLQRVTDDTCEIGRALYVLSETLRAARALYPLAPDADGRTVTIQIGELKAQPLDTILNVYRKVWVLVRHNDLEASAKVCSFDDLNTLLEKQEKFWLLDFLLDEDVPTNTWSTFAG